MDIRKHLWSALGALVGGITGPLAIATWSFWPLIIGVAVLLLIDQAIKLFDSVYGNKNGD